MSAMPWHPCRTAAALLLVAAFLAGCAAPVTRPQPPTPAVQMPAAKVIEQAPVATPPAAAPAPDFWQALRADFAFVQCTDDPAVAPWLRRYRAHPKRLEASLARALPRLRYIAGLLHEAGIPGEFALLPWVESSFRVLRGRGDGPAGLWQIMPATGRSLGLRIDQRYDARLDLHASTQAAAQLLQRYDDSFHDWRLADLAYNTGMYRVKKLLGDDPAPIPAEVVIPDIGVGSTTSEHLAKLVAMACLVQQPERYDVRLPADDDVLHLHRVELANPLPLPLAAHLAGLPEAELRNYNAAYLDEDLPARALLLPGNAARDRFQTVYARLAQQHWTLWQRIELRQPATLASMVDDGTGRELLAGINNRGSDARLATGTRVWLPASLAATLPDDFAVAVASQPRTHRVVAGDNLWTLARRFHVRVADIKLWNDLDDNLLHLGKQLRLEPPDDLPTISGKALN